MRKSRKLFFLIFFIFIGCKTNKLDTANLVAEKKDSLAFELSQIYGLDQGIRKPGKFKDIGKLIQRIDTINFNRIVEFVKQNGFPNKKLLGEKNWKHESVAASATAVLLHNPHRLVHEKEYFDFFLNEVNKGNLDREFYAAILDKYYWTKSVNKKNRTVFYGSQFGKPCIQTKESTNKARIEIGLKILKDDEFVDCSGEILDMLIEKK